MSSWKWFGWIISCAVVIGVLSGCAGMIGRGELSDNEPATTGQQPIRLTLWGGVPPEAGPQMVIDHWNRSNPDVQVEYVRFVNDDDGNLKLDTALLTGQNVDLYVNYALSQAKKRIEARAALDLARFDDYDIDVKMGPGAEPWKVGGKYYGIPTKRNAFFIALNKEALQAENLLIPKSWTWDEMREYAKKLTKQGRYGFVQHLEPFVDPLDSVLVKEGYLNSAGSSNLDHPLIAKWLVLMYDMMFNDKSTPIYGEQLTSKMPVEYMFLSGEAAMLNIGEWLIRSANNTRDFPRSFTIAFAPVPRLAQEEADFIARGGLGDYVSINPKSANIEAAWAFLKWYAEGGMIPMAVGGRLPASLDADRETTMKQLLGEIGEGYDVESLEYVLYGDDSPVFVRSVPQQVLDMRTQEYERYFLGDQTLKQTLGNMKRRHEEFLFGR